MSNPAHDNMGSRQHAGQQAFMMLAAKSAPREAWPPAPRRPASLAVSGAGGVPFVQPFAAMPLAQPHLYPVTVQGHGAAFAAAHARTTQSQLAGGSAQDGGFGYKSGGSNFYGGGRGRGGGQGQGSRGRGRGGSRGRGRGGSRGRGRGGSRGRGRGGRGGGRGRTRDHSRGRGPSRGRGKKGGRQGPKGRGDPDAVIAPKYLAALRIGNSKEEIERWRADRRKLYPRSRISTDVADIAPTSAPPRAHPVAALSALDSLRYEYASSDADSDQHDESSASAATPRAPSAEPQAAVEPSSSTPQQAPAAPPVGTRPIVEKADCRHFVRTGSCRHGDSCRFAHRIEGRRAELARRRERERRREALRVTGRDEKGRSGLLRRLLMKDIRRERRVFLQCVRWLRSAGFLVGDAGERCAKRPRLVASG